MIGPFAAPKKIYIVGDLPKTRSGKASGGVVLASYTHADYFWTLQIMRRIMRKIVAGESDQLGDLSTLAEPGVVELIKAKVAEK